LIFFLRTDSRERFRLLRVFEPLMVITGIVQPLATLPSLSKLYLTHTQHASGQSLTTWSIFALASLLWVTYGLLNRKPAIYVGNIIGLLMDSLMVNGILLNAGWTY
jgi:MtN3 and saliva related transmembrane protein